MYVPTGETKLRFRNMYADEVTNAFKSNRENLKTFRSMVASVLALARAPSAVRPRSRAHGLFFVALWGNLLTARRLVQICMLSSQRGEQHRHRCGELSARWAVYELMLQS